MAPLKLLEPGDGADTPQDFHVDGDVAPLKPAAGQAAVLAEALLRMAGKDADAYRIQTSTRHGRELATVRSRTHDPPSLAG